MYFRLFARWFCHFDDDNYVNVPALVSTLQNLNPGEDVYLGKPSLIREMEVGQLFMVTETCNCCCNLFVLPFYIAFLVFTCLVN